MNIKQIIESNTDVSAIVLSSAHSESLVEPKSLVGQLVLLVSAKYVLLKTGVLECQVVVEDYEGETHVMLDTDLDVQL